jgi:hypothetical protein
MHAPPSPPLPFFIGEAWLKLGHPIPGDLSQGILIARLECQIFLYFCWVSSLCTVSRENEDSSLWLLAQ